MKNELIIEKKINLKKILFIQYQRNYFELPNKKLRITIDTNLKIFQDYPLRYINIDKTIVELKYKVENSTYVKKPPFFDNLPDQPEGFKPINDARILLLLADSVTTDHI